MLAKYRHALPQLSSNHLFLSDGGLETTLVFHHGLDLPHFAAFDLLKDDSGYKTIHDYFHPYLEIAHEGRLGFILESATWRASSDWAAKLGYSMEQLAEVNIKAVALLENIRKEYEDSRAGSSCPPLVISGCMGPRGDAYNPDSFMTAAEAEYYHSEQIRTFQKDMVADLVTAFTLTYTEEAIGLTRAAQKAGMPVVISFTLETDGRLPSGQTLQEAIEATDAATDNGPAYYMINCAHPTHFQQMLEDANEEAWTKRIQGIRANASKMSHAELDEAEELDDGDTEELGCHYRCLKDKFGHINVLGGCCGMDHRHIAAICTAVTTKQ